MTTSKSGLEENGAWYRDWKLITAFLVLGINPSWALPCALFVEVPIIQQTAPEGLMLAAWMNIAINLGLVITLTYVLVDTFVMPIPTEAAICFVIIVSSGFCAVLAFTYTYTAFGMSVVYLLMSIMGGMVGTFQVLVFLPYLTKYDPYLFATVRLGDVIFVGILSGLGMLQQAVNISPDVFFILLAPTQVLPLISMWYISTKNPEDFMSPAASVEAAKGRARGRGGGRRRGRKNSPI